MFQLENYLSDVGGTLGLWLGLSVLSMFELVEFLLDILVLAGIRLATKCRGNNTVQKVHIKPTDMYRMERELFEISREEDMLRKLYGEGRAFTPGQVSGTPLPVDGSPGDKSSVSNARNKRRRSRATRRKNLEMADKLNGTAVPYPDLEPRKESTYMLKYV